VIGRVEELIAIRAAVPRAMGALLTMARFHEWMAPELTLVPLTRSSSLVPGERFKVEIVGELGFDYEVEAVSAREVVFSFRGPWSGRERWSFIADGADTLVRRVYEVEDASLLSTLAWRGIGKPLVIAHYKLELSRFRDMVERDPGPRAEIEAPPAPPPSSTTFPVDEG
jgi:hypothetical protein